MDRIKLHDQEFRLSIRPVQIRKAVGRIAENINHDLAGKNPLFLSILNGSFMFTSDLLKQIKMNCQVSFIKLSSYHGAESSGIVTELIGLDENIEGRHVIIVEDIVDTGNTLENIVRQLNLHNPGDIKIATLLLKPEVFNGIIHLDYVGMEIPNDFIVGYGLDYNELGRNFEGIYKMVK
ncbi:MAG: hypoxanthine phosphoribosyltransferase [Bacteroidales bacterium]